MPIDPLLLGLFVATTAGFIITPGPIVSLIIAETLRDGPRHGIAVVLGATVVSLLYLSVNLFGFASIAALPQSVLDGIRYAGALYLLYLAWQALTRPIVVPRADAMDLPPHAAPAIKSFQKSFLICLTSPKTILFFAAFFPQFVDKALPITPQLVILSVTFLTVAALMDSCWVLVAAKAKKALEQRNNVRAANRISGAVLALGAILLLFINQ